MLKILLRLIEFLFCLFVLFFFFVSIEESP